MNKIVALLLFLIIYDFSLCQESSISFQNYSTKEGLSQSSVVTIFQDDEGFLWFGTYGGLNRFDGYNFKVFHPHLNDPYSLSDDHVRAICQDTSGFLWVGTTNGLNKFFPETNEFLHFKHDPSDTNSIAQSAVYNLLKDSEGNIWVGTWGGGVDKIERIEGNYASEKDVKYRFAHYTSTSTNLDEKYISKIIEAPDGSIYASSSKLYQLNKKTGKFKVYSHDPANLNSLSSKNISAICADSAGYIWAGTWDDGLNRLDPKTDSIVRFYHDPNNQNSLSHNIIMSLFCDKNGTIWAGTWGGGLNSITPPNTKGEPKKRISPKDYTFSRYTHKDFDNQSISGNSVYSIYQDNTGTIWVGTDWSGVNKFYVENAKFRHIYVNAGSSNGLVNNIVYALFIDKNGKLWIGTQEGLNVYDKNTNTYKLFKHDPNDPSSLSFNQIRSINQDKEGNIWIGTLKGLNKYNPLTNKFTRYYVDPSDPGGTNNLALYITDDGIIWIGNYSGGLYRFDPSTEKFRVFKSNPDDPESLSDNQVWSIVEDEKGDLWVATGKGGLCKFDRKSERFISYKNIPGDSTSITGNSAWSLYIDHNKNLWVGTSSGLNKLTYKNGKAVFLRYLDEDNLPVQGIAGIVEDKNNQLWLTTSKGLLQLDPENGNYTRYTRKDGLQDNEFSFNAIIMDKKTGEIYAGGINGFNIFVPDNIMGNDIPPEVKITDLKLFNKSVNIGDTINHRVILNKLISALDFIELSYKENVITFEFAALHYKSPEDNQYAYKLEGFEDNWNNVGNQRMATYTNLDPGNYIFRVKASNSDKVWNQEGTFIRIYIKPPFWQTWWFRIIGVVLFISALISLYYIRTWRMHKRNLYLEHAVKDRTKEIEEKNEELLKTSEDLNESNRKLGELVSMKDKLFSILGHDLKNPINAILGFSDILRRKIDKLSVEKRDKYIDIIYKSTRNTYELLQNILDWARSQEGLLEYRPSEENIVTHIEENIKLCKEQANEKNIKIEFSNHNGDVSVFCDARMINTVLRNLIVNAVKYSNPQSSIKITLNDKEKEGYVVTQITDKGIGLDENQINSLFLNDKTIISKGTAGEDGTGLGLMLCKEFVEINKGKIWVESEPNVGSTFSFSLPVKNQINN